LESSSNALNHQLGAHYAYIHEGTLFCSVTGLIVGLRSRGEIFPHHESSLTFTSFAVPFV